MIEEQKKNTKSIKEIIAKYKNKNFIISENPTITQQDFTSKNFFGIQPKKLHDESKLIKSSFKIDQDVKSEFNHDGKSEYSSFNIKHENFLPTKIVNKQESIQIPSKANIPTNGPDANINHIHLDTSGNSFEMLNMVKKAMNNNSNFNDINKINLNNIQLKDTHIKYAGSPLESPYNQSHDYNNLKAPLITANNYYLNSPYRTESVNVSFVKQIEDRIAHLKQKINTKKQITINFEKIKRINRSQFILILQFMNYEFIGFFYSCKLLQCEILNIFKEGSKLVVKSFENTYNQYFSLDHKKLALSISHKKGCSKHLKLDLVLQAKILSKKLVDKTVCLCSINKYHLDNSSYKNIYKFDVKKPGPLSIWIMREYTNFHQDDLNKAYFQPIISFCENDIFEINVNVLSERGMIDISNFVWQKAYIDKTPSFNFLEFKENHKYREIFDFDLTRFCEIEVLKNKWSDITNLDNSEIILERIKELFEPYFYIQKVLFEDVGYMMFKIFLIAANSGFITKNPEIGISIKILNFNEIIVNEVKKNCLIYDRLNEVNVRVGDIVVFYYSKNKDKEK